MKVSLVFSPHSSQLQPQIFLISLNKKLDRSHGTQKSPELVRCSMTWFQLSFSVLEIYSWNFLAFFIARYFLALITSENCRVWPKLFLRFHAASPFLVKNSRIEIYCHSAQSFTVSFARKARKFIVDQDSRESQLSDRSIIEGCDRLRDHAMNSLRRSSADTTSGIGAVIERIIQLRLEFVCH